MWFYLSAYMVRNWDDAVDGTATSGSAAADSYEFRVLRTALSLDSKNCS